MRDFLPSLPTVQRVLPAGLVLTALLSACSSREAPASVEAATPTSLTAQTIGIGTNNLSYETPSEPPINGYGPYEINESNGGAGANDGGTLTLAGKTYTTGLGVHADSRLVFNLGAQCRTFTADIGVDDEVGANGSVTFKVLVDNQPVYDSGVMTGATATKTINVDIEGAERLTLVVDGGGDITSDHADWADAKLLNCIDYKNTAGLTPDANGVYMITTGGTYTGAWRNTKAGQPVLKISTTQPVTIQDSSLAGRSTLIVGGMGNVDLTVNGSRGYALNPNPTTAGANKARFVDLFRPAKVAVRYSLLKGTAGILVNDDCKAPPASVIVQYNRVRNIDGRKSDGAYGLKNGIATTEWSPAQFVQLNGVRATTGTDISWNEVINDPGNSRVEDNISIFASSGTSTNMIKIHDNYIQGAYHAQPTLDGGNPQYSGGGIMLSDGQSCPGGATGSSVPAWVYAYNNQVVSTGNYGLAITSGHDNLAENNRVVSRGRVGSAGATDPNSSADYSNALNLYNYLGQSSSLFFNNTMRNNTIGLWRFRAGAWQRSDTYLPGCAAGTCVGNASLTTVDLAAEQAEFTRWQNRVIQTGVRIGPL